MFEIKLAIISYQFILFIFLSKFMTYSPEFLTAIGTLLLAIFTFLAILVALFQERIKDLNNRSELKAEIILKPPHSHLIALRDVAGNLVSNCIYIRILITNIKGRAAENVEVMAVNFWKIDESGNKTIKKSFLPMNLKWSHYGDRIIKIPKSLFRHCDLGSVRPFGNTTRLVLDTMTSPNPVSKGEIPNVIEPGKYEFEILVGGDNTNVIKKRWELYFDNVWEDEEDIMLNNHIKIMEII